MRIALAPFDPDLPEPLSRLRTLRATVAGQGVQLLALAAALPAEIVEALAADTADAGPGLLLGLDFPEGRLRHRGLALLEAGRIAARRARHVLTRQDPLRALAEADPGPAPGPVAFRGLRLGLLPDEDWHDPDTVETLAESGAELLLALETAPFAPGAAEARIDRAVARVVESGLPFAWLGRLGGAGDFVCEGGGFVLNADRALARLARPFDPAPLLTDWRQDGEGWHCAAAPLPTPMPEPEVLWRALLAGLRHAAGEAPALLPPAEADPSQGLLAQLALDALGPARLRLADAAATAAPPRIPLEPVLAGLRAALGQAVATEAAALVALAEAAGWRLLSAAHQGAAAGPGWAPLRPLDPAGLAALREWRQQAPALAEWGPAPYLQQRAPWPAPHPPAYKPAQPGLRFGPAPRSSTSSRR